MKGSTRITLLISRNKFIHFQRYAKPQGRTVPEEIIRRASKTLYEDDFRGGPDAWKGKTEPLPVDSLSFIKGCFVGALGVLLGVALASF